MSLRKDIQTLEPGNDVRLLIVDCTPFGGELLRFHGHTLAYQHDDFDAIMNPLYAGSLEWFAGDEELFAGRGGELQARSIWFQGNEYKPWPVNVEGLETNSSGTPSTPTLSAGNVDGSLSAVCLYFDDLLQAKVTIKRTLSKYLDSRNFVDGNPDADPSQESVDIWYIDRKASETNEVIQWELSSPADVSGQTIPARIISGVCEWCMRGRYRGPECGYTGPAMFTEDDEPTDDPGKDKCGGIVPSCKVRFGEFEELPFGGFPGASLLRSN